MTADAYFREFNMASVALRLILSMICGGLIGLERESKQRGAGFRTYMLVEMGATLTMLLGEYMVCMLEGPWAALSQELGLQTDVSRFGAQVINGIGFLGAGTVMVDADKQHIKGLTTAAGLWASGCMGLAIGAGFYECVILAFILSFLSIRALSRVENYFIRNSRNVNLYLEFRAMEDLNQILGEIRAQGAEIYEVDLNRGQEDHFQNSSAVISLRLKRKTPHAQLIASMTDLKCIRLIQEI